MRATAWALLFVSDAEKVANCFNKKYILLCG